MQSLTSRLVPFWIEGAPIYKKRIPNREADSSRNQEKDNKAHNLPSLKMKASVFSDDNGLWIAWMNLSSGMKAMEYGSHSIGRFLRPEWGEWGSSTPSGRRRGKVLFTSSRFLCSFFERLFWLVAFFHFKMELDCYFIIFVFLSVSRCLSCTWSEETPSSMQFVLSYPSPPHHPLNPVMKWKKRGPLLMALIGFLWLSFLSSLPSSGMNLWSLFIS